MNLNKLYQGEIEGENEKSETPTSQEEAQRASSVYLERFEVWSGDETSQIIINKIRDEQRKLLNLTYTLAASGSESELRAANTTIAILSKVLNLMIRGEYKL